jgi:hypothetical protein
MAITSQNHMHEEVKNIVHLKRLVTIQSIILWVLNSFLRNLKKNAQPPDIKIVIINNMELHIYTLHQILFR